MKCIYCVENKPESSFRKVEHVIPQSFGVFTNNLTLTETVCDECNKFFGDQLELFLARDSLEGALRFELGLKFPSDFKSLGRQSKNLIRIAEGDCEGAYAYKEYSKEQDKIALKPVPQIGVLKKLPFEYEYFLLNQIPDYTYLDKNGFILKHPRSFRGIGIDVDTMSRVLSEKGINFQFHGEEYSSSNAGADIRCEVQYNVDSILFRAVAKIAFNYLAFWEGRDFTLLSSFDTCRQFIRLGKTAGYPLIYVDDNPILKDEPIVGERSLGHIITVNWTDDNKSIVSQLSLLNFWSYRICLSRNFEGERRELARGHFFNVNNKEIFNLERRL